MLEKRKELLLMGVLTGALTLNAYEIEDDVKLSNVRLNYEVKAGITPYERYGDESYSERFNDGLDFGLEVYKPFEKYSIGVGGEVKRKLNDDFINQDGERLYAYYLLGKKHLGDSYSLVARLGKTSQKEFDSKYYVAAGIEKRFNRLTVQLLGENTRLENDYHDKSYTTVGLKFGYIFGDLPAKASAPAPIPEPVFKLIIEGDEVTGGYEAYKTEVPVVQQENIKEMVQKLNDYDKPGTLEMKAYSDNTGSKELNVQLANERMNNLEREFVDKGLTEKVEIQKVNPEETVKNIYKVDNDTFENRKLNRRIEVSFFEDETDETTKENDVEKSKELDKE